jgi:hypothetical protein
LKIQPINSTTIINQSANREQIIEVRDMNTSTTEDAIMYYFESKKGANTDVEKVQFIEDKNMYLVTFEEEEGSQFDYQILCFHMHNFRNKSKLSNGLFNIVSTN